MTLDEFNKNLQNNKEVSDKYSALLKAAIKDASGKEEYPKIMSKIAADLGFDVSEKEFSKKAAQSNNIELSDDELAKVAGGTSQNNEDSENFLLFFPWWSKPTNK